MGSLVEIFFMMREAWYEFIMMAITVTSLVVAVLALAGVAKLLMSRSTAGIPTLTSVPVTGGGGPQYNPVHFNDAGV